MSSSISSSEFGVPEFRAYNPNPYCGGYDLTLTYGKPLPPSHSTCYPPPDQLNPPPPSLNGGFSYASIPSPYGGSGTSSKLDQTPKWPPPPQEKKEKENQIQEYDGNAKLVDDNVSTNGYGSLDYDYTSHQSWTDYGYGNQNQQQNQDDDLGPCPSIFGYWPCLYKMDKKIYGHNNGDEQQERDHRNQWEVTAEYFFGSNLYPYGEQNQVDVSYGYNSSYRHQKQCLEEPISVELEEYSDKSLIPELGYYGTYQEDECLPLEYTSRESNLAIVPINYGSDGHYGKQPPSVHVDHTQRASLQKLRHGQPEYPSYDYVEYNGRSSFERPGFDEAYTAKEFPALGYLNSESNQLVTSYERHYPEQSHLLHVEYNEQCQVYHKEDEYPLGYVSGESNLLTTNGYERQYPEQSHLLHVEYNEQCQVYHKEDEYSLGYASGESNLLTTNGYERQYPEQSHLLHVEYNELSTFQKLGQGEVYREEDFPAYKYGEDFFSESNDKYNYYKQRSY